MNLVSREYFEAETPIGLVTLIVGTRLAGTFYSPLPLAGNILYLCRFCGETFAKRLAHRPDALWSSSSGFCQQCATSERYGAWQSFRLPGEEALGWGPAALLAEEFLFNTKYLELKDASSSKSGGATEPNRPEDYPVRRLGNG